MSGIPGAVLASLSALANGLPQPPRDGQCTANQRVAWDEDDNRHRCRRDSGHDTGPHMCMHCTHTWDDA